MKRMALAASLACGATLALGAVSAAAALVGFQTPDHKVGCYASGQGVRCDVRRPRWDAPPPPAECELDYGHGVFVDRRGPAEFVCAGDTTLDPRHDVLRTGRRVKTGRFKCKNKGDSRIKCVNTRNRHGFAVSKERVRLF